MKRRHGRRRGDLLPRQAGDKPVQTHCRKQQNRRQACQSTGEAGDRAAQGWSSLNRPRANGE